jgi:hypothetical protein
MASRPKRVCTERTRERISRILEWENCTENSSMFRAAAAQMDREFKMNDGDSDYADANEEQSSEYDSAMEEDDDSSAHSPPSSAADADDVPASEMSLEEPEKNITQATDENDLVDCSMHAAIH